MGKQRKQDDHFVKKNLRRQMDKENETRNSNFIKENKKVDSVTNSKCKQRNYLEKEKKPDWMFSNTTNRLFTPNSKLHQQPKKKQTENKKRLLKKVPGDSNWPDKIKDEYESTKASEI